VRLRVESEEDNKLKLEVGGEGHTLLNLLQSHLLNNKSVSMAGYSKPHPLMDRSVLYLTLGRGKNFNRALLRGAKDSKNQMEEFIKKFEAEAAKNR